MIEETYLFNSTIKYPDPIEMEGYSFNEWGNFVEYMPAEDFIAKAQWTANSYEIVFDFSNGTVITDTIKYGETIEYPEVNANEEYDFDGWKPRYKTMPACDLTVNVQWIEAMRFVEIVLEAKDLTETEVIELLKKYTNAPFSIDMFVYDNLSGTIQIIIKFNDSNDLNEFIDKVIDSIKDGNNEYFRDISAVRKKIDSYSYGLYPLFIIIVSFFLIHF